jgi:hypothetical protein
MSNKRPVGVNIDLVGLEKELQSAVRFFWRTRGFQSKKQLATGTADQGTRGAVTGGKQMDGFVKVLCELIARAGMVDACIFRSRAVELPGFFRPTKQWDLLVVADGQLLAVLELKSQIGPSFGNNFNNRTEEAMGSAMDLWTAYREKAFAQSLRPWLGYVFLLEDCPKSRAPVSVQEPHFPVFPEFREASYMKRYELFCRKLILERQYDAAAFLTSTAAAGVRGKYAEPGADLTFRSLGASLMAKMAAYAATRKQS